MQLLENLRKELRPRLGSLLALSLLASLSTLLIITSVSTAAQAASRHEVSLAMAILFIASLATFAVAQHLLMGMVALETEHMVHRMRIRLFAIMCTTEPSALRSTARGHLFAAITHHTQVLSRNLSMIVMGCQQTVLVLLVSAYLAFLSMAAFAGVAAMIVLIVFMHVLRMRRLGESSGTAERDEDELFEQLEDILRGQRELRLSRSRSASMAAGVAQTSAAARQAKSQYKRWWAQETSLLHAAFYVLVGITVFLVPLFSSHFHAVAFPGTMAVLFLIGPVGSIASAIPVVGDVERALGGIRDLENSLGAQDDERPQAQAPGACAVEPLGKINYMTLCDLGFAYPVRAGEAGFRVGPLAATFASGQISFITGGNGSGKTTLVQLLTGLQQPSSGALRINGRELLSAQMQAWRDSISVVFSDGHLFSRLHGIPAASLEHAGVWLDLMELASIVRIDDGAFSTLNLSSGQRKRLALVAAVLEDKPVLVLDEWAADQDPHFRKVFYEDLLPQFRAEGRMVICITHDDAWFHVADQRLHMADGQLVCTPDQM